MKTILGRAVAILKSEFSKIHTVFVINCSGNIHTDEIIFTSTVISWYQIGFSIHGYILTDRE